VQETRTTLVARFVCSRVAGKTARRRRSLLSTCFYIHSEHHGDITPSSSQDDTPGKNNACAASGVIVAKFRINLLTFAMWFLINSSITTQYFITTVTLIIFSQLMFLF